MYLVIPTSKGEAVLDSLSSQKSSSAHIDDRMEQVAQSLTALLKCTSCLVYASESHDMVLEVQLPGHCWLS
ncbi:MAG TPA: hypothetical protein VG322_05970 [Candidatus Acidoferrales bacterium]|jgi:hypothetical protein|nr:hypothetical protein [Candidatus Acidoferrales bacterium]